MNTCDGAALSGGAIDTGEAPIPRQERGEVGDLVIGDTSLHVGEPSLRIDVVELARLNEREHDRRTFATTIGSGEQPCLAPESNLAVILPISGRMS